MGNGLIIFLAVQLVLFSAQWQCPSEFKEIGEKNYTGVIMPEEALKLMRIIAVLYFSNHTDILENVWNRNVVGVPSRAHFHTLLY